MSPNYFTGNSETELGTAYANFSLLPVINFYWVDEPHLKDRGVIIGWLFWEKDIQLNGRSTP